MKNSEREKTVEKMSDNFLDHAIDSWLEYNKRFQTKEEMNNHLRDRMIRFIKETKTTQREIARRTRINESVISQWKHNKDIGFNDNNKLLHGVDVGSLNMYLMNKGF